MAFYSSSASIPSFVCICMWPQYLSGCCGVGKGLSVDLTDTLEEIRSEIEKRIFFPNLLPC